MAIDITQFHQTFFEESLEGIDEMESGLLQIEEGMAGQRSTDLFETDKESLNTIFRAVHSIKGGSATFGFNNVAEFSHVLESLLDELREGRITKNRRVVNVLLQSIDCLRHLLGAAQTGDAIDQTLTESVHSAMEELLKGGGAKIRKPESKAETSRTGVGHRGWKIRFKPEAHMLKTSNDPARILRALSSLGKLGVKADTSLLPEWDDIDPESVYLGWDLELETNAARDQIMEVFAWVIDDCQLDVEPMAPTARASTIGTAAKTAEASTQSIRISTGKIDALVDLVGELVITQTMLSRFEGNVTQENVSKLMAGLSQLERNTRDLQEGVMSIRMLPVGFAFNKLPRMVRDVSNQLGKNIDLKISGESTELDKTVVERISDSLLHLVRNCIDHGIESPEQREAANKPKTGTVTLNAYQEGGNVVIEIEDDGQGLNREKILAKGIEKGLVEPDAELTPDQIDQMIFLPGFSTADIVTDVSGRGVGTDAVRTNIQALRGNVEVFSEPGQGTRFILRLPLTLAIMDGLSIVVGNQTYILPMLNIVESIHMTNDQVIRPAGGSEKFSLRDEILPLTRLYELFHMEPRSTDLSQGIVVVVEADSKKAGIFVDELLGQQQVVVKSLEEHHRKVEGVATATILGDGEVALILDVATLVRLAYTHLSTESYSTKAAAG